MKRKYTINANGKIIERQYSYIDNLITPFLISHYQKFIKIIKKGLKKPQKCKKKAHLSFRQMCFTLMVEATGLEPTTFWSLTKRATKLRYASIFFMLP